MDYPKYFYPKNSLRLFGLEKNFSFLSTLYLKDKLPKVLMLSGSKGIGKSTLLLQLALTSDEKILYVSGEESENQIKMRAQRVENSSKNCLILTETSTQNIFQQIEKVDPQILIIDSIQTLHTAHIESSPGSVSQIRECTSEMIKYAKQTGTAVFLIGHINKEGAIAGPKILEHMVDTVLQFEGDRNHVYRILRTIKNRFGSASELGVYEMTQDGLREVNNPSLIRSWFHKAGSHQKKGWEKFTDKVISAISSYLS